MRQITYTGLFDSKPVQRAATPPVIRKNRSSWRILPPAAYRQTQIERRFGKLSQQALTSTIHPKLSETDKNLNTIYAFNPTLLAQQAYTAPTGL